jgi:hypothetical protein
VDDEWVPSERTLAPIDELVIPVFESEVELRVLASGSAAAGANLLIEPAGEADVFDSRCAEFDAEGAKLRGGAWEECAFGRRAVEDRSRGGTTDDRGMLVVRGLPREALTCRVSSEFVPPQYVRLSGDDVLGGRMDIRVKAGGRMEFEWGRLSGRVTLVDSAGGTTWVEAPRRHLAMLPGVYAVRVTERYAPGECTRREVCETVRVRENQTTAVRLDDCARSVTTSLEFRIRASTPVWCSRQDAARTERQGRQLVDGRIQYEDTSRSQRAEYRLAWADANADATHLHVVEVSQDQEASGTDSAVSYDLTYPSGDCTLEIGQATEGPRWLTLSCGSPAAPFATSHNVLVEIRPGFAGSIVIPNLPAGEYHLTVPAGGVEEPEPSIVRIDAGGGTTQRIDLKDLRLELEFVDSQSGSRIALLEGGEVKLEAVDESSPARARVRRSSIGVDAKAYLRSVLDGAYRLTVVFPVVAVVKGAPSTYSASQPIRVTAESRRQRVQVTTR